MEKDQNINSVEQDNEEKIPKTEPNSTDPIGQEEVKEITPEEKISKTEPNSTDPIGQEEVKEITPEEKIKVLEDKVIRTLAEMENQRRRFEKEKDDAFDYGGFAFAREALNLIDNLERSKQILENDNVLKNTEALKITLEHFDIINKDLFSVFSKNNIIPIDSIGKKLDPNMHQAMMEIENDQKIPGTIIKEIQKGFMMKDRLLRPALVGVSKKTENKDQKTEENIEKSDNK